MTGITKPAERLRYVHFGTYKTQRAWFLLHEVYLSFDMEANESGFM